ncbi:DivIVA domain-containing protein [Actinomadura opuntiae]|uniref:DivIVA domain-containing protein n=1 Tax=Actinomadura sp. OS1-43 TaxID=604315 RepID=UPI00255AF254|nr:DivIVA domain-containing protein [Actinomadura sp. OS1-43]MDL4818428.1 DivIVA domain-containing protein [Actinomadura sp. OS1-43]
MGMKRPAWQTRLTDLVKGPDEPDRDLRITPEAVRNRKFATTRLTQGYAVHEVDAFLDLVTNELARLIRERDEARAAARRPACEDPSP